MIQSPIIEAVSTLTLSGEMQHRARSNPRDDYDRLKDSLAKVKAENRKLKKENSQLKKQLLRIDDTKINEEVDEELEASTEIVPQFSSSNEPPQHYCPRCREQSIQDVSAGIFTIRMCKGCGYRKRVLN